MKKTILTSIIALAALVAMPAAAQTDAKTGATKTEQAVKAKKEHKGGKEGRPDRRDGRQQVKRSDAFEGITLTDQQKEALKALRPQRPERPAKKDSVATDTVARPNPKQMRADYVNGVKNILTPEQYVVFLENVVINEASIPGQGHDMRKGGDRRQGHGKMQQQKRPERKQGENKGHRPHGKVNGEKKQAAKE